MSQYWSRANIGPDIGPDIGQDQSTSGRFTEKFPGPRTNIGPRQLLGIIIVTSLASLKRKKCLRCSYIRVNPVCLQLSYMRKAIRVYDKCIHT